MIEGMWVAYVGEPDSPQLVPGLSNAAVLVFETQRMHGSDAQYYYAGTYNTEGDWVNARAYATHFNGQCVNAFGVRLQSFEFRLTLVCKEGVGRGHMQLADGTGNTVPLVMIKKAELPIA